VKMPMAAIATASAMNGRRRAYTNFE
jgi:hypothetical protein